MDVFLRIWASYWGTVFQVGPNKCCISHDLTWIDLTWPNFSCLATRVAWRHRPMWQAPHAVQEKTKTQEDTQIQYKYTNIILKENESTTPSYITRYGEQDKNKEITKQGNFPRADATYWDVGLYQLFYTIIELVQVHNKERWIKYSGIARATFWPNLGITSRASLKENMKSMWIEVSLFPLLSFPLTGYTVVRLITTAFCPPWTQKPCQW